MGRTQLTLKTQCKALHDRYCAGNGNLYDLEKLCSVEPSRYEKYCTDGHFFAASLWKQIYIKEENLADPADCHICRYWHCDVLNGKPKV